MREVSARICGGDLREAGTAAKRAADFLHFAAAPTFAVMALATGLLGDEPANVLCSVSGAPFLSGMMPMYLLMSAFHAAPWLRLVAGRRQPSKWRLFA